MENIPVLKKHELMGSIVPQLFSIKDNKIIYFDKINQYEGKFYIIDSDGNISGFEVGEGQGIISSSGAMYLMKIDKDTEIIGYSYEGRAESHISLKGLYFSFEIDEYNNYVCLGNIDGVTTVKIINKYGEEASEILKPQFVFGSCIYIADEDLYIGSCSNEKGFKISCINYIGNKKNEWIINAESHDRIIGKIQKYENFIFATAIGKYDSMIILNTNTGKWKEIFPGSIGIKNFIDFNIYNNVMYILAEKNILEFSIEMIMNMAGGRPKSNFNHDTSLLSYNYLMYSNGLETQLEKNYIWSAGLTIAALLILFSSSPISYTDLYGTIILSFSVFWSIHFTVASIMNLVCFTDKTARINQLLSICSSKKNSKYIMPFFMSLTVFSIIGLIIYPQTNIFSMTVPSILTFSSACIIQNIVLKNVRRENEDVIIELLQDDDEEFKSYLKKFIETFRKSNCEKFFIDILSNEKSDKNIVMKWAESRGMIIGGINRVEVIENRIIAILDMSKRDIKYSRYSIIMDYICYMKKQTVVKEISIGVEDDQKMCN